MAELLRDGSIRMRDGRILWGRDVVQIIDVLELSELLVPAPKSFGGGFGGGGRGVRGLPGPTGTQGLPGIISLVQDEGFNLPLQNTLNFIGDSVSVFNDPGNGRLNIIIDDIYAATRVVSLIAGDGTDLTLEAAIAALPAEGGKIYLKQGTYVVPAAGYTLPNKDVVICGSGWGTIFDCAAVTGPLFKIPDGLTQARRYEFHQFFAMGATIVGQEYLRHDDASGFGNSFHYGVKITAIETLVNFTKYDTSYDEQTGFVMYNSSVLGVRGAPFSLAVPVLAKTPNPAGTYAGSVGVKFYNTFVSGFISATEITPWTANFDGDLWISSSSSGGADFLNKRPWPLKSGSFNVNGFMVEGTSIVPIGVGDIVINGNGWDLYDYIHNVYWNTLLATVPFGNTTARLVFMGAAVNISGCGILHNVRVKFNVFDCSICDVEFLCSFTTGAPIIEIASSAHRTKVVGVTTRGATTDDHIQIASQRNVVSGCVLDSVGGLTVEETGAADYNLVVGCNGISTGGGFSVPGANSLVTANIG
jgi:hypothetical protein